MCSRTLHLTNLYISLHTSWTIISSVILWTLQPWEFPTYTRLCRLDLWTSHILMY